MRIIKEKQFNYKKCNPDLFNTQYQKLMFGLYFIRRGHSFPTAEKILLEDFNNIQKYDVIEQTVYRNEIFQKFYNVIKQRSSQKIKQNQKQIFKNKLAFKTNELETYFPKSWLITRYLRKNNPRTHMLYISILDFSNKDELLEHLNFWIDGQIIENNEKFINIFNEMQSSKALFYQLKNTNKYSIMFLRKNQFSIDDLKHQFCHYVDWLKDKMKYCYMYDPQTNDQKQVIKQFKNFFKINDNEFQFYCLCDSQYQRLVNNFLSFLKILKNNEYSNLTNYEFAKKMVSDLIIGPKFISLKDYLIKIQNLVYIEYLKKNISAIAIIFYNIIGFRVTNIKNHIFGFFSKTFKQIQEKNK